MHGGGVIAASLLCMSTQERQQIEHASQNCSAGLATKNTEVPVQ